MSEKREIYFIQAWDPRSTEYHPEGREYVVLSKGAFVSKEVAQEVINGIRMFQEIGDETTYSVRTLRLDENTTFEGWLDDNLPGRRAS
jgi:hypothetical protein